jgi:hypothetical protein
MPHCIPGTFSLQNMRRFNPTLCTCVYERLFKLPSARMNASIGYNRNNSRRERVCADLLKSLQMLAFDSAAP